MGKITKHKMQSDEALKILHIEGLKNLNAEALLQVRAHHDKCTRYLGHSTRRGKIDFTQFSYFVTAAIHEAF